MANYVLGNYGRFPIAFERGEGSYLWSEEGRRYLDFSSEFAVCALGHSPMVMQEALRDQSAKLIHCSNLYHVRKQAELARFVVETMMGLPAKSSSATAGLRRTTDSSSSRENVPTTNTDLRRGATRSSPVINLFTEGRSAESRRRDSRR
jgi:hypothetical protein